VKKFVKEKRWGMSGAAFRPERGTAFEAAAESGVA
jgi:hypothetical protein